MDYLMILFTALQSNSIVKITLLSICFDVLLGVLVAMLQKRINSTIGIDGIIRKMAMIVSIIVFMTMDLIMSFNLAFMIPTEYLKVIGLEKIGLCEFFALLFIAFELLSCCKNGKMLGLPIPKRIDDMLEKLLTELTDEGTHD